MWLDGDTDIAFQSLVGIVISPDCFQEQFSILRAIQSQHQLSHQSRAKTIWNNIVNLCAYRQGLSVKVSWLYSIQTDSCDREGLTGKRGRLWLFEEENLRFLACSESEQRMRMFKINNTVMLTSPVQLVGFCSQKILCSSHMYNEREKRRSQ